MAENQVVVFLTGEEGKAELTETLSRTSFTFVFVNLQSETKYPTVLKDEFGVDTFPAVFKDGKPFNLADLPSLVPVKETLEQRLVRLINQKRVVLFMKGEPSAPQCGFSAKIVKLIEKYLKRDEYGYFDIFTDQEIREGLKTYSKWPTYPQLFVKGVLLGGIDVCQELDDEGEFEE